MSEQKYKHEIDSLKRINESLKTKIRVRGQELGFRSEELANAIEMVRMSERIRELEVTNATQREKELEAELKSSQLARNELRMEFEEMRDLFEESQIRAFFFQLMTEHDTPEIQSLTEDQFDTKIKRFFKMMSDQYPDPDDKKKCLAHGKEARRWLSLSQHPDKNSNDPCAKAKFQKFLEAYANFKK